MCIDPHTHHLTGGLETDERERVSHTRPTCLRGAGRHVCGCSAMPGLGLLTRHSEDPDTCWQYLVCPEAHAIQWAAAVRRVPARQSIRRLGPPVPAHYR